MSHTVCLVCKKTWIFNEDTICPSCDKQAKALSDVYAIVKSNYDLDIIMDLVSEKIIETQLKIDDSTVRRLADAYFQSGTKTSERLQDSNKLYLQIDHTHNMVVSN